ncbi:MAG: hypothetical protein R6U99_04955 [Nioella sp.]
MVKPKDKNLLKILNLLVYELYLKEKFFEENLYDEKDLFLAIKIAEKLFQLDFERYKSLYIDFLKNNKNGIKNYNNFTHSLEIKINNFIDSIRNDDEITGLEKTILQHPWVNKIENFMKRYDIEN